MHSVLLIDDHDIVRLGLESLLSRDPELRVAGSVDSLRAGLEHIARFQPDLVISDMGLGDAAGLQTVHALVQAQAPRPVLMLTMQDEAVYAEKALALGAAGYLAKDCVQEHLAEAVRQVLAGQSWISPRLKAVLVNRQLRRNEAARRAAEGGPEASLSLRELQVLELLREGRTTKEIAARLNLSHRTVDIHRANLKKKLGLRSGAELIAFASSRF